MTTKFRICNCNRTMPLNAVSGERLGKLLGTGSLPVASQLCGRDAGSYLDAVEGSETVVVGCTQESALFRELAEENKSVAPLRFVNLRETGGWSGQAYAALPKMAALLAEAALPEAEPVPTVSYESHGRLLIVGRAEAALPLAAQLHHPHGSLNVTVLLIDDAGSASLPMERDYPVFSGSDIEIDGWLGAFAVRWRQRNPIDLDLCVRCNECIASCPENAINLLYQVDEEKCQRHGDCVRACGAVGAIDFSRDTQTAQRAGEFDLVLDLSASPLLTMHQPPQGYLAPGANPLAQLDAVMRLTQLVGEFEKPKYFHYKERLCVHSRNRKTGCHACIDICSADAIRGDGDRIKVEPHLCVGCGACTTVCPSGALAYTYPSAPHTGKRLKTLTTVFAEAGGGHSMLLFHGSEHGADLIAQLGRLAKAGKTCKGMPARVVPVELHHIASAGLELWLSAISYGAVSVSVLVTGKEAPQYIVALKHQLQIAQAILSGLGYSGTHFSLIEAGTPVELDVALQQLTAASAPPAPARFDVAADKRNALDFALDHLYQHAPLRNENIPLPEGAPFGTLAINKDACTLCMACTGACPTSALMATPERPQLRFIEKNCVQCGLCVNTCPEQAIQLSPRLVLSEEARKPAILNETEPFHCIRCNKPIGAAKVIEGMLTRLAGHSAFVGNLERIKMCGDCRVVDMMQAGQTLPTAPTSNVIPLERRR